MPKFKERIFRSTLSEHIKGLLAEKRACGYLYNNEERLLLRFDEYWIEQKCEGTILTIANLENWCKLRECENPSTYSSRITVVSELAKYQNGLGIPSYIPEPTITYEPSIRHILTQPERIEFFQKVDEYRPKRVKCGDVVRMADEYPMIFRLIYHCGLRIAEACSLPLSQVDLEHGVITILNAKNDKDRLVYMADDLTEACRQYVSYMKHILGKNPKWLFPGQNIENHLNP